MGTEVVLVRHGETDWNAEGRLQGQNDPPLNGRGREQAENVALHLAKVQQSVQQSGSGSGRVEVIYSSDLVRASATAEEIAKRLGVKLQLKKEFREKCLGVMEGLTLQEARKKVPDAFDKWRKGRVVPGSEDKLSVQSRLQSALDDIEKDFGGRKVVVVTHGGILNSIHRLITGIKFPGKIPNTSLSTIFKAHGSDKWEIGTFALCDHLTAAGVEFDNRAFGGVGETG
ncbi:phosphoglycerate mutase [Chloropicon primus]|uniref:Phosphoglycerate mutase n=1 Tax=Chloropicon primus TaxID=1764295 RepID=A0A5B8MX25_9CHLO|nr:phosphoglycerate mutase [Chloropicon primus]UPR03302.1 phosphoglycerate mutase [Chloropicon primus]|eukprot:QDZ24094.1 phosphoglycerate mutase [Chloropicon primus]